MIMIFAVTERGKANEYKRFGYFNIVHSVKYERDNYCFQEVRMIVTILMIWVGLQLNAPTWFYAICAITIAVKIIIYGINMYKEGQDNPFDL